MLTFKIIKKSKNGKARVGEIHTAHGVIQTPIFVPVGTQATVKSLTPNDLKEIGVQLMFGNTYHLHLRPGEDIIESLGGLAKFQNWNGPTITDSGGFQVFSLARSSKSSISKLPLLNEQKQANNIANITEVTRFGNNKLEKNEEQKEVPMLVKISEEGVLFRSHIDGSQHMFTPEVSIAIQKKIGADIILSFDQCSSYPIDYVKAKEDMDRTHRWALRSLQAFQKPGIFPQSLYGIVQGSIFQELRKESAQFIASQNFDGIAIGGVSVGENKKEMIQAINWSVPFLPEDKPRHLLGIGDVDDIFEAIERGIDTLDCVSPSRLGRVGSIFVNPPIGTLKNRFRYDVTKSLYARSPLPLDNNCDCYVCQNYTQGYINHLFRAHELLAYHLATYHNVYFMICLSQQIREALLTDDLYRLKNYWLSN